MNKFFVAVSETQWQAVSVLAYMHYKAAGYTVCKTGPEGLPDSVVRS